MAALAEREVSALVRRIEDEEAWLDSGDPVASTLLDAVFDEMDHPVGEHLDGLTTHLRQRRSATPTEDPDVPERW